MNSSLDGISIELLGGVGIELSNTSKQMLFDLISQLIPEKDYFQSFDPGYTYINGNVTKKGHVTICYGIKNSDLQQKLDASNLKIKWQRKCAIREIQINLGYQGLYYVIVAIPEVEKDIYLFNDWIRSNNDIHSDSPPFDPHIALCYVKNKGNYPSDIFKKLQEKLIGKTLKFESVHFSPPNSRKKIYLSKF